MSRSIGFFGLNEVLTSGPTLNDFTFTAIWSLRKVYSGATSSIRIFRESDSTQTDIGFVGDDLDTTAINTFCSGTNGFIQIFYDQSGSGRNATFAAGTRAKIYDSSTGLNTTNGKVSCKFSQSSRYDTPSQISSIESFYFVASAAASGSLLNYLTIGIDTSFSYTSFGVHLNTNYSDYRKFGTGIFQSSEKDRGLETFLSGRNLGSVVYSATASLYVFNRNGSADSFGTANANWASTTIDRGYMDSIGRSDNNLSLNGDFQELFIGASGSNTGLTDKNTINNLINDYWEVY